MQGAGSVQSFIFQPLHSLAGIAHQFLTEGAVMFEQDALIPPHHHTLLAQRTNQCPPLRKFGLRSSAQSGCACKGQSYGTRAFGNGHFL